MHRRALLQWMVASGGLTAFSRFSMADLDALGADAHRRVLGATVGTGALTASELATVAAIAECIIPRTDTPGATDAGVAAFIDLMLTEWYPAEDLARVRENLIQLDAQSREVASAPFARAAQERQVAIITALDSEVARLRRSDPAAANAHWFGILKYLTVWGYCTSEVAMRELFHSFPPPMAYNGAAPVR
jgi:hypothetical protein